MKIIIALDAFKHCFTAVEGCRIAAETMREIVPDADIMEMPMADGGEGTAQTLMQARGGEWIPRIVTGPRMDMQVEAGFAWFGDTQTALVEMATASGIELLSSELRNPLGTSTYGTGELLAAARDRGARKILLAVGGSATTDLGMGMAAALGWRFLDRADRPVLPVGENMVHVHTLRKPEIEWDIPVEVLCDVTNPLLGERGAAQVYGPQKGANPSQVVMLEMGLAHLAGLIDETLHIPLENMPGAGAAGGLSAGAVAFLGARLVRGVEAILNDYRFHEKVHHARWVLTGEGQLDSQSLDGKVVSGVLHACASHHADIAVFAGRVKLSREILEDAGIASAIAITPDGMDIEDALPAGKELLKKSVRAWAEKQFGNRG